MSLGGFRAFRAFYWQPHNATLCANKYLSRPLCNHLQEEGPHIYGFRSKWLALWGICLYKGSGGNPLCFRLN